MNNRGLKNWLDAHSKGAQDDQELEAIWDATGKFSGHFNPDVENSLSHFQNRISSQGKGKVVGIRPTTKVFQIAATIALLVVAGFAISEFSHSNEVAQIEMVTGDNETRDMVLTDGSQVSLNSHSYLSYPESFDGTERTMALNGEAFFEVARNEEKPFLVKTENILVQVLGTSFNVRDLNGENYSEVYVETGKVAVTVLSENKRYTLEPGQKLIVNKKDGKIKLSKEATSNPLAWKTKVLRFKNAPLSEIFMNMERVFDIKISTENNKLNQCPFTTTIRATQLKEAFKALETSCDLTFNISSPGEFKVSGECCE